MFVGRGRIINFNEGTFTAGKPHVIEVQLTRASFTTIIWLGHYSLTIHSVVPQYHQLNQRHDTTQHNTQIECDLWPEISYGNGYKGMEVTVSAAPVDMEKYEQVHYTTLD